jgi:quinolinate synthase
MGRWQMNRETLVVAHYYTSPEVQHLADFVGDSLALIQYAEREQPKRLVFAGVRFMAETAKVMLPDTEVIQPDINSTCSLVTQTNIDHLRRWREQHSDHTHVMYINSSVEMKTLADIIVTSSTVTDIVSAEYNNGNSVLFSPDRNMGAYINREFGYDMKVWSSVCEVHDGFTVDRINKTMREWTDGPKYLIAHPESPIEVLNRADYVGSTSGMLNWVKNFDAPVGTIFVATEDGLLYNMRELRPDLDIRGMANYTGCACSSCLYMKMNTVELVKETIAGRAGTAIDYLSDDVMHNAHDPIKRMLDFSRG